MMAVVVAISEKCRGDAGKWVHFGATSNDILDTATALQIKDAIEIFEDKLKILLKSLLNQAEAQKHTVCCGRTHGQIGVPTNLLTEVCYLGLGNFKTSGPSLSANPKSNCGTNDRSCRNPGCIWEIRNLDPETYDAAPRNWSC